MSAHKMLDEMGDANAARSVAWVLICAVLGVFFFCVGWRVFHG